MLTGSQVQDGSDFKNLLKKILTILLDNVIFPGKFMNFM